MFRFVKYMITNNIVLISMYRLMHKKPSVKKGNKTAPSTDVFSKTSLDDNYSGTNINLIFRN